MNFLNKSPGKFNANHQETGWGPLPLSLKIFFAVMLVLIVGSFFSLQKDVYFVLGFVFSGLVAKILFIIFNIIAPSILLMVMLKRTSWAFKYALVYLVFLILNGLSGTISYTWLMPEGFLVYLWPSLAVGIFLNLVLIAFLVLFWRARAYFR